VWTRAVNIAVATMFLLVGILATLNSVRLNNYIEQTLPRDREQELCQLQTLQALRVWAVGRGQIEDAKSERDRAVFPLLQALEKGQRPSPEVAAHLDEEYAKTEAIKDNVQAMLRATPIPTCPLLGKYPRAAE